MFKRIFVLALLAGALAAPSAGAAVLETAHVTATSKVQTWRSQLLSGNEAVYAILYSGGHELTQQRRGECAAIYAGGGVLARLRIDENCGVIGSGHYVIRYVSVGSPKPLTIRLETENP